VVGRIHGTPPSRFYGPNPSQPTPPSDDVLRKIEQDLGFIWSVFADIKEGRAPDPRKFDTFVNRLRNDISSCTPDEQDWVMAYSGERQFMGDYGLLSSNGITFDDLIKNGCSLQQAQTYLSGVDRHFADILMTGFLSWGYQIQGFIQGEPG
jgi:hypothetical protein